MCVFLLLFFFFSLFVVSFFSSKLPPIPILFCHCHTAGVSDNIAGQSFIAGELDMQTLLNTDMVGGTFFCCGLGERCVTECFQLDSTASAPHPQLQGILCKIYSRPKKKKNSGAFDWIGILLKLEEGPFSSASPPVTLLLVLLSPWKVWTSNLLSGWNFLEQAKGWRLVGGMLGRLPKCYFSPRPLRWQS